jgi:hypothetical protein
MREQPANLRESPGLAVRASRMAGRYLRSGWRGLAVAAAAGIFMASVGAFGTGEMGFGQRLLYWAPTMLVGSLLGFGATLATRRRPQIGDNPYLLWAVVTLAVSIPGALLVWWYTGLMFGARGLDELPYFFVPVALVSAAMTGVMMAVNRPGAATHAAPVVGDAPPARPAFFNRLTPKIAGGVLFAVEAEDHYLRVRTSKGDDLILMRLSDAIAELDGVEGAQVHRSWWVARDGFTTAQRDGGRVVLLLKDGAAAPVSRPNVQTLKAAGWF